MGTTVLDHLMGQPPVWATGWWEEMRERPLFGQAKSLRGRKMRSLRQRARHRGRQGSSSLLLMEGWKSTRRMMTIDNTQM